ncbi:MAG: hypothetical protein LBU22_10060 [Dysgonamonadaceae bacterium]|jgi:hypothetical protein|nr:hypothetical protein [Dysgonamonadaceae bacterium]
MKKIVLTAVLLLSMSALIFAQQPRGGNRSTPEETAKRTTEWMTGELKLTPEQVVKVDSINLVFAKKQAEQFQRGGQGGDRETRMAAFQKLNSEKEVALEAVLSKEQMDAYKKALETRGNRPGGGGGGRGNRGGGN